MQCRNCSLPSVSFHCHYPSPRIWTHFRTENCVIIHFLYSCFCLRKCCSITSKSAFLRERMMSIWSEVSCAWALQLESHFSEVFCCCSGAVGIRISFTPMLMTSFPRICCCWTLGTVVTGWLRCGRETVNLVISVSCITALTQASICLQTGFRRSLSPDTQVQFVARILMRGGTHSAFELINVFLKQAASAKFSSA